MTEILFGIIIPAAVFFFSTFITWLLYRRFSRSEGRSADRGR